MEYKSIASLFAGGKEGVFFTMPGTECRFTFVRRDVTGDGVTEVMEYSVGMDREGSIAFCKAILKELGE